MVEMFFYRNRAAHHILFGCLKSRTNNEKPIWIIISFFFFPCHVSKLLFVIILITHGEPFLLIRLKVATLRSKYSWWSVSYSSITNYVYKENFSPSSGTIYILKSVKYLKSVTVLFRNLNKYMSVIWLLKQ